MGGLFGGRVAEEVLFLREGDCSMIMLTLLVSLVTCIVVQCLAFVIIRARMGWHDARRGSTTSGFTSGH